MPLDTSTDRNRYWQAVRGLCILTVVLIHSQFQFGSGEVDDNLLVYERQFLNFPVATFMFLSGYFVNQDRILDKQWLTQRASRLLVPFLVWSALFTIMGFLDEPQRPSLGLISVWIFGLSSAHLYFPLALFQIVLLTPWLRRMMHTSKWWIPLLITPAYFQLIYLINFSYHYHTHHYLGIFAAWVGFYYTGMIFRLKQPQIDPKIGLFLVIVGLAASFLEASVMMHNHWQPNVAASQLRFSSLIFATAMISLFWSLRFNKANKILAYLGDASFGIYFVHLAWLVLLQRLAEPMVVIVQPGPLINTCWQVVQVTGTIILSIMTIRLTRLILNKRLARLLLGF